jgi:hypothetical protein
VKLGAWGCGRRLGRTLDARPYDLPPRCFLGGDAGSFEPFGSRSIQPVAIQPPACKHLPPATRVHGVRTSSNNAE